MKFRGVSEDLLATQTAVRVLRELLLFPARESTGRQIARNAGTPVARTIEALNLFERYGLVDVRGAGRSQLWTVRRDHLLNLRLTQWFEFERGARTLLVREIAKALSPLTFVRRAAIFGSVARGDERPSSDVDLFILIDDQRNDAALQERLASLRKGIQTTFGNPLRFVIYDQGQWEKNRNRPLVKNIERDGLVVVDRPLVKTERIEKARAATYWLKAQDFERTSRRAAEAGDWNGAALMAVHSVISATDAMTSFHLQLRSRNPNHEQVSKLIESLPLDDAREKSALILEVLDHKNVVAYEAKTLDPRAVQALMKKASRFLQWAERNLKLGST